MWPLPCTSYSPVLPPSPAHTLSLLSTPPAVSYAVSQSRHPHSLPHSRLSDYWLVLPGDLRPVSMPPEYNWMAEAKEPSMGKRGSRGTHTHKHAYMQKTRLPSNTKGSDWCRALLHTQLNTFQLILWLSMVVWLCEDTYLPGMYPTERWVNINARKLHLYSCSGNEGISMWPILTSLTILQRDSICIRARFLHSSVRKSMNNIKVQHYCRGGGGLPLSISFSQSLFLVFHIEVYG